MKRLAQSLALAISLLATPAQSDDPAPGVWHLLEPGDTLSATEPARLFSVGIHDGKGTSARLYLVPNEKGAVVSVTLPDTTPAASLTSTLLTGREGLFSREVGNNHLLITGPDETGTTGFSFAISQSDIRLFMLAREWQITIAGTTHRISLKGSKAAITAARARLAEQTEPVAEGSN